MNFRRLWLVEKKSGNEIEINMKTGKWAETSAGRTAGPMAVMGRPRALGPCALGWDKTARAAVHGLCTCWRCKSVASAPAVAATSRTPA
jgi:hypothetical protein